MSYIVSRFIPAQMIELDKTSVGIDFTILRRKPVLILTSSWKNNVFLKVRKANSIDGQAFVVRNRG